MGTGGLSMVGSDISMVTIRQLAILKVIDVIVSNTRVTSSGANQGRIDRVFLKR